MTIQEIKDFLTENKDTEEVKGFLAELIPEQKITSDIVKPFLETQDGKLLLQPLIDKRITDAIKTFREGHFDKEVKAQVAAEILKINPQMTPEQKQIIELREEMEKERKLRERDNLKRQIVEEAARQKVPTWWVDDFSGNTIEEAKVFLAKIKGFSEEISTAKANEILANGHKPGSGQSDKPKIDLKTLTSDQVIQLELEGKLDTAILNSN